ncbi:MAG: hypothetical protein RL518_2286 [Pseudomonadota bacterium]|jgi:hypothetical protein
MGYMSALIWGNKQCSEPTDRPQESIRLRDALERERRQREKALKLQKKVERALSSNPGWISKIVPLICGALLFLPPASLVGLGYASMTHIKSGEAINAWSPNLIVGALPMILTIGATSAFAVCQRCGLGLTCGYLAFMTSALVLVGPEKAVALGYIFLLPLMLYARADDKGWKLLGVLAAFWVLLAAGAVSSYFDLFPTVGNWPLWSRPFDALGSLTLPEPEGASLLLAGVWLLVIAACVKDLFTMTVLLVSMPIVVFSSMLCAKIGVSEETAALLAHGSLRVLYGGLVVVIAHSEVGGTWRILLERNLPSVIWRNKVALLGLVLMIGVEMANGFGLFTLL